MPADDHHHCKECGKVCAPDRDTCSAKCREAREARTASRRQLQYLFYILIAVIVIVLLLQYVHL